MDQPGTSEHPAPPLSSRGAPRGRGLLIAWGAALLGWTLLLSFYDLDGGAEFEVTDAWVAQTAREMLEADDWIVPRFSGETRLQKSPGAYWAVMLAAAARGGGVDEAAARLPSAVAAVVIVLVVLWLARRIGGDRAAIFAGFAAASSVLVLYWSHRAASDLGLAALVAVALACLWVASSAEPPGRKRAALWLVGYFAAGLGMLYKMPMPLVCVGLPAACWLVARRRWRVLASGWHLLGLVAFCLPWLPWALAVLHAEPTAWAKWKVEFWDRFTGDLPNVEHQTHWHYYLMYLFPPLLFTVPYTLSLPAAIVRGFRRDPRVNRDGMVFMLIWFFSLLAFFTVAVGKETRYILPALPPLFVLLGVELSAFFDPDRSIPAKRIRTALAAVWVLVPTVFAAGTYGLDRWVRHDGTVAWQTVWPRYAVAAAILTVGFWTAAALFGRGRRDASFAAIVVTMWAGWLWIWPMLMPLMASEAPAIDFAAQLRDRLPVPMRPHLRQIGHQDSRIIWYSDVRFPRIIDPLELLARQAGRRSRRREERLIGLAMLDRLAGDDPALLVAAREHYLQYLREGPELADASGRPFVRPHLWIQTNVGKPRKHYVVFGNQPPPWPEPELAPPAYSGRLASGQTCMRK